jgi:type II secretory pathway pseudopilin PulG
MLTRPPLEPSTEDARPPRPTLRSADGFTLTEMLVAILCGVVVTGALLAVLELSLRQDTRISDRVQADRRGRTAMNVVLDQLRSGCTGFGSTAIQAPSSTPTSPLESTGATNLWFLSGYANPTSGDAYITKVTLHDINWQPASSGAQIGTLTDYAFEGSGESPNWVFPTLSTTNATAKVLATNVVPLETSKLFHYSRYDTSAESGTYGELVELGSGELPPTKATAKKIASVNIAFKQAPEGGDTREGHTTTFSGSAAFRFTPPESSGEGATCA